ncbi:purine-nucleoside phosphorylase [Peredibacter sp. HCB2-198]|uniref:purine-nucleoside phosphorylase n=1 Tax=Peredibacter sp. HCB2-198 TaxID=3383025 RepID=UPI0038B55A2B
MTKILEASQYILSKINNKKPKIGIVLGSGLGIYIDQIQNKTIIPYQDIPHFKRTSVEGHSGALIVGEVHGVTVAALQGRLHAYEGYAGEEIVLPVRTLAALGVETVFLTNASGGINPDFHPGDLVAITDHINLSGRNPLVGPNIAELGPRFPDMGNAYDKEMRDVLHAVAKSHHVEIKDGVYCSVLGPTYETPAEIRMMRIIGADLVGMSTVPEVIAANHLGLKVVGVACITNYAAGIKQEKLSHADVKKVAEKAMVGFATILTETIGELKRMGKV